MEILVTIVIVFMVTFAIFGVVNMFKQINKVDMDIKPKIAPYVGHELESQKEEEKLDVDFMRNWIQEKSGKKSPISQKRKPTTINEWEDEVDIGGNS